MPEFKISDKEQDGHRDLRLSVAPRTSGDLTFDLKGESGHWACTDLSREEATKIRNYLDNWLEATK